MAVKVAGTIEAKQVMEITLAVSHFSKQDGTKADGKAKWVPDMERPALCIMSGKQSFKFPVTADGLADAKSVGEWLIAQAKQGVDALTKQAAKGAKK